MRNLILPIAALSAVGGVAAYLGRAPEGIKAPNGRYGPSAISTSTVRMVQDYTVLISNESMEGISRGTGVLLSSTTVLTCAHVVPEDKSTKDMWIYPYPGSQVVRAKLRFINYPKDLALLELETPVVAHAYATVAKTVEIGEPIVVVGNIRGYMLWFVSYGMISGTHARWVLTDATIRGGNSGGPWANARGEVVAITDVGWSQDGDMAVAGGVPADDVREFLAKARLRKADSVYALTGE